MSAVKKAIGYSLVVFGLLGLAVEIDHCRNEETKQATTGVALIVLCVVGGAALIRSAARRAASSGMSPRDVENAVLASARIHNGRVTVTDVAADSHLTFSEAKRALDDLARAGACETQVTGDGMLVYNFGEIVKAASKTNAS
jgi:hypothetical protein